MEKNQPTSNNDNSVINADKTGIDKTFVNSTLDTLVKTSIVSVKRGKPKVKQIKESNLVRALEKTLPYDSTELSEKTERAAVTHGVRTVKTAAKLSGKAVSGAYRFGKYSSKLKKE